MDPGERWIRGQYCDPVGVSLLAKNDNPIHLPEHKRRKALAIALTLTSRWLHSADI